MAYRQITLFVHERIAEQLSDALMEHGALSTAIEDAYAGTDEEQAIFGEPGMPGGQLWQHSKLIALFNEEDDAKAVLAAASAALNIEAPAFQTELLPEQDWVRLTQSQFDPIKISNRLWITPTWHQAPDADAVNLQLDPGLAFGTGSHPTTHLCLQWLDKHLQGGESILDYGCGSGILGIAAARLGAGRVLGCDIDDSAVDASRANAERNAITNADWINSAQRVEGQYDIVVANILTNPLCVLAPSLVAHVQAGGRLALSGVLATQAQQVIDAYAPYIALSVGAEFDGWIRLEGREAC